MLPPSSPSHSGCLTSPEMVFYPNSTWHHNPEDLNLNHHCSENLKSHVKFSSVIPLFKKKKFLLPHTNDQWFIWTCTTQFLLMLGAFSLLSFLRKKSSVCMCVHICMHMHTFACMCVSCFNFWNDWFSWILVWTVCHWRPPWHQLQRSQGSVRSQYNGSMFPSKKWRVDIFSETDIHKKMGILLHHHQ